MAQFGDQSPAKRRKISATSDDGAGITSHIQLRDLLVFNQSNQLETKYGINRFKSFLSSINEAGNENDKSKKLRILKAYCDSQIQRTGKDSEAICFRDLIQTWSFADVANNESLLLAVPAVLTIFLKTISTYLQFQDFGLALCKFLLQKDQIRLFNRNLSAPKAKEHIISPCIRLLTEIVSFDGGTVARLVHLKRDITFKRIDVFLTPIKAQNENAQDSAKKSTLRRNAQRYILANIRYQSVSAKSDLIEQHKIVRAFLEHIRKDSRDIVTDILRSLDKDIARDSTLSRTSKTRFFNRWNLERLVTLYGYDKNVGDLDQNVASVTNEVHKLLTHICTVPDAGVLLPETGWYPAGSEPEALSTGDDGSIELGLDSAVYIDKYRESVPIRNGTLSALAKTLRPESDTLQIELLLAIFNAAPELIADFFTRRTTLTSDPKPTAAWFGESAFLFSIVHLSVPENCGWRGKAPAIPPPVSIVIESILPRPLTQKILTRCLNQNTDVVTLFAIRILTAAFRKLRIVLDTFNVDRGHGQTLWAQASSKLLVEFCRRCPLVKDVLLLFRRTSKEDLQQQDAVTELITQFYEVVPAAAFEESFDVSLVLIDLLNRLEAPGLTPEDSEMLLNQLRNVLKIAQLSSTMRWWQQPASLQYSAFTSLLKVLVEFPNKTSMKQIRRLLQRVLLEHSVLINSDASFDAFMSSFEASNPETLSLQLTFFDNCICRLVKKPVYYQDLVYSLLNGSHGTLSPIVVTVDEQWRFVVKSRDNAKEESIAIWIAWLLGYLRQAGENERALKIVRENLINMTVLKKSKACFKNALKNTTNNPNGRMTDNNQIAIQRAAKPKPSMNLLEVFGSIPAETKNHNALHKWEKGDIDAAIEQGYVRELILCLCSKHDDIRRQAAAAISHFMIKVKDSKHPEWRVIYLLTGELLQTAQLAPHSPLHWIVGEFSTNCLTVLTDPLHKMYSKVNLFLQKRPSWDIDKIPSYWIDKILLHEPDSDNGSTEEINWLLDWLVAGLRTPNDLEILRRTNVFERMLSLYTSPTINPSSKMKILHLVFRATQAGGSTTLTTRVAIVSWIQGQIVDQGDNGEILGQLANIVYNTSDRQRVDLWSSASISHIVEQLAG